MNNPLLNTAEQAHIDAVRANHAAMMRNEHNQPDSSTAAFVAFVASRDYSLLFRVFARLIGALAIAYLTYSLKAYADVDGLGAFGSIGHYVMGLFFFYMTLITGEKYQTWNFMFLLGLFGIVATF